MVSTETDFSLSVELEVEIGKLSLSCKFSFAHCSAIRAVVTRDRIFQRQAVGTLL